MGRSHQADRQLDGVVEVGHALYRATQGWVRSWNAAVAVVERDPAVRRADPPLSAHFGPETLLVTMRAEFDPALNADGVARAIDRLHGSVQRVLPEAKYVFIEPRPPDGQAADTQATAPGNLKIANEVNARRL